MFRPTRACVTQQAISSPVRGDLTENAPQCSSVAPGQLYNWGLQSTRPPASCCGCAWHTVGTCKATAKPPRLESAHHAWPFTTACNSTAPLWSVRSASTTSRRTEPASHPATDVESQLLPSVLNALRLLHVSNFTRACPSAKRSSDGDSVPTYCDRVCVMLWPTGTESDDLTKHEQPSLLPPR